MKIRISTAVLAVALATSTAAIAGPRDYSDQGVETPGALFNCVIPSPGPGGFRLGPCWLDYVGRDAH